jgi:hypothetical protein
MTMRVELLFTRKQIEGSALIYLVDGLPDLSSPGRLDMWATTSQVKASARTVLDAILISFLNIASPCSC